ncbi:Uncharacterised protein [Salmonella enterica subsp. arizonae]|uniref:Uncharacterized protein n=1 Tax=Salmonella enterica subsp. arizonae TaxID=59203 RepID=A0A2X4T748_SALER|nr:hypothetical protein N898_01285 [Salmonella enterica subsp. arizonae serovar 62:z36:- str. RKS2983]SQI22209.1 Uncharacterised protein [Salmonella enterica subsp. arizonae]VEA45911.1 Uncharacterised protein [Salmonella enterica subsp. arizonae]
MIMMAYYKDKNNAVYIYDAYSTQDLYIKEGLVLIIRSHGNY